MRHQHRSLRTYLLAILVAAGASHAQDGQQHLSGTWVLTGQYYASGAAPPPMAERNINNTRMTITGETSGGILVDEPMFFGTSSQNQFSCRGTIKSRFTVSRVAGLTILHETSVIETAGRDCRQMAGSVTDLGDSSKIVDVSGNAMRIVNGLVDADRPTKSIDMTIFTYRRFSPSNQR